MAGGRFSKQADWFGSTPKLNNNYSDTTIGGALTTAPSGLTANQGTATMPGDRVIFSPSDALAISNNSVGTLYTGTYRYVASRNNSTSAPTRGHAAFWDTSAAAAVGANNAATEASDALYQITSDEPANFGGLFAGVFVNNMTKGNYWWIQESGKTTCVFRTTISGVATQGQGVYLALAGNNANAQDVGAFDQIFAENQTTIFAANGTAGSNFIDNAFVRYVGVAEQLPVANNTAGQLVDITLSRASFRW
jgi:hypothetical protein